MSRPELPLDWRRQMVELVRGAAPEDGSWFTGGPALSDVEQLRVYKEQYRLRLGDAVIYELRGLSALLGDGLWELARAYLADRPSQHFTLDRVADAFPDWLQARGAPLEQVEMARLDVTVSEVYGAADSPPFALTSSDPVLQLTPATRLLRLKTSVFRTRSASLMDEPVPPLEHGDFPLLVFRPEHKVRHLVLPPGAYTLLSQLQQPTPLSAALTATAEEHAEALQANLGSWMQLFAGKRILQER